MNMSDTKLNASEVYDPNFVMFYTVIIYATSIISLSLTSFLIFIIQTQTPTFMNNLKIYFVPYCFNLILMQLVWLLYMPIFIHPYIYFCPVGLAKYLPEKLRLLIIAGGGLAGPLLIDGSIGIALERTFALTNIENMSQVATTYIHIPYLNKNLSIRKPLLFYAILLTSCFLMVIFGSILFFIPSLLNEIIVPSSNIPSLINSQIIGLENFINVETLLIFKQTDSKTIPKFYIFIESFIFLHCSIIIFVNIFNGWKTIKLKNVMVLNSRKSNAMLLRMSYLQFLGYSLFLVYPTIAGFFAFKFLSTPSQLPNYLMIIINFFALYDTIMTIICIKPYRSYVLSLIKKSFSGYKIQTISVVSVRGSAF